MIREGGKVIFSVGISLLSVTASFAQNGYLGKAHALHIDFFRPLYEKQYTIDYKWSFMRYAAFYLSAGFINRKETVEATNLYFKYNNEEMYIPNKSGEHTTTGLVYSIGLLYNNAFTNMSMPIGFYSGMIYETHYLGAREKFTLGNELAYPADNNASSSFWYYGSPYDFKSQAVTNNYFVTGKTLKFVLGRTYYLGHNFCADIGLEGGARWVKAKLTSGSGKNMLSAVYPQNMALTLFTEGNSKTGAPVSLHYKKDKIKGLTYFLMPVLRAGYMF